MATSSRPALAALTAGVDPRMVGAAPRPVSATKPNATRASKKQESDLSGVRVLTPPRPLERLRDTLYDDERTASLAAAMAVETDRAPARPYPTTGSSWIAEPLRASVLREASGKRQEEIVTVVNRLDELGITLPPRPTPSSPPPLSSSLGVEPPVPLVPTPAPIALEAAAETSLPAISTAPGRSAEPAPVQTPTPPLTMPSLAPSTVTPLPLPGSSASRPSEPASRSIDASRPRVAPSARGALLCAGTLLVLLAAGLVGMQTWVGG